RGQRRGGWGEGRDDGADLQPPLQSLVREQRVGGEAPDLAVRRAAQRALEPRGKDDNRGARDRQNHPERRDVDEVPQRDDRQTGQDDPCINEEGPSSPDAPEQDGWRNERRAEPRERE